MKANDWACEHFRDVLPAYTAGALDPLDRRLVQEHLEGCQACRADAAGWRKIRDAAMAAPAPLPSPSVLPRVWAEIDRDERGASRATSWKWWVRGSGNPGAAQSSRRGSGFGSAGLGGRSVAALHLAATVTLVAAIVVWALAGHITIPFRTASEVGATQPADPSTRMLAVDMPAAVVRDPSFASLTRLALDRSDEVTGDGFPGTTLLAVDSGTVTVEPGSAALVVRADTAAGTSAEQVEAGQTVELRRGDAISLLADAGYVVRTTAAAEAEVMVACLYGPGPPQGPKSPAVVAASGSTRLHLPAGPVAVDLTRSIVATTTAVSGGERGAVMLWIEEGSVTSLAGTGGAASDAAAGSETAPSQDPPLVAGDAIGVKPGVGVELHNDGLLPAVVLTLVVTPVEDAASALGSPVPAEARLSPLTPDGESAWRPIRSRAAPVLSLAPA